MTTDTISPPFTEYQLPATMDSHGRILIPASIRKVTNINPLTNIVVKVIETGIIISIANS